MIALIAPVVLLMAHATPLADDAELARHQGTWAVVSFLSEGEETPPEIARTITRVVDGDHVTWYRNGKAFAGTSLALDPAVEPKALDVIPDGGAQRGKTVQGIYRLDGDELTICMAAPGASRPRTFEASRGSGQTLMRFRREKGGPGIKPGPPPAPK